MRRTLILLLLGGAGLVAATAALAGDHCDRPMRDWRPRQAVEERARNLGVEVSRIRTDDGCYKIYGRTADGRFKQTFSAKDDYGVTKGQVTIALDLPAVDRRFGLAAACWQSLIVRTQCCACSSYRNSGKSQVCRYPVIGFLSS